MKCAHPGVNIYKCVLTFIRVRVCVCVWALHVHISSCVFFEHQQPPRRYPLAPVYVCTESIGIPQSQQSQTDLHAVCLSAC